MNPASSLQRWREIVHPLFWPVFLWNLRGFVTRLEALMEAHGTQARLVWAISWWGWIHIEVVYPADAPAPKPDWATTLSACTARVRAACSGKLVVGRHPISAHPRESGDPVAVNMTRAQGFEAGRWIPAFAGMCGAWSAGFLDSS